MSARAQGPPHQAQLSAGAAALFVPLGIACGDDSQTRMMSDLLSDLLRQTAMLVSPGLG